MSDEFEAEVEAEIEAEAAEAQTEADTDVTVYVVRFTGSAWTDDDGYDRGSHPFDEVGVYGTRGAAEAACRAANGPHGVCDEWGDAADESPLARTGEDDWEWADRVRLPWPVFCDWCLDNGVPRPLIDIVDEAGAVCEGAAAGPAPDAVARLLAGGPPDPDEMRRWWYEELTEAQQDLLLAGGIVRGPDLYAVRERTMDRAALARMVESLRHLVD